MLLWNHQMTSNFALRIPIIAYSWITCMHIITKYKHKYLCVRWIIVILLSVHFQKTKVNLTSTLSVYSLIKAFGLNVSNNLHTSRFVFCLKFCEGGIHGHIFNGKINQTLRKYHRHRNIHHSHFIVIAGSPKAVNRHGLPMIIQAAI